MFLTDIQKAQIKQLLFSSQWKTIENVVEELIKEWKDNSPVRESTDDTLREVYTRDGKERGIRDFLQRLLEITQ